VIVAFGQQRPDLVEHGVRARGHLAEVLAGMLGDAGDNAVANQAPAWPRFRICASGMPSQPR
jgi:hypothetical protein